MHFVAGCSVVIRLWLIVVVVFVAAVTVVVFAVQLQHYLMGSGVYPSNAVSCSLCLSIPPFSSTHYKLVGAGRCNGLPLYILSLGHNRWPCTCCTVWGGHMDSLLSSCRIYIYYTFKNSMSYDCFSSGVYCFLWLGCLLMSLYGVLSHCRIGLL